MRRVSQKHPISLQLKTITPIHIGGASGTLLPSEVLFLKKKEPTWSKVQVIWAERFEQALEARGWLVSYLNERDKEDFDLQRFLQSKDKRLDVAEFLRPVTRYTCVCPERPGKTYRPFLRDGLDQPYLPGSVLKGPLRSAILYTLLSKYAANPGAILPDIETFSRERLKRLGEALKGENDRGRHPGIRQDFRTNFDHYDEGGSFPACGLTDVSLEHVIFQHFTLADHQRKFDAHSDIFRTVEIPDSRPFPRDSLKVFRVNVINVDQADPRRQPKIPIDVECLPPGISFEVRITIDRWLLDIFISKNPLLPALGEDVSSTELRDLILNPLEPLSKFAEAVLMEERKQFQSSSAFDEEPNVRLGWGGGLLSTSLFSMLAGPTRQAVRNVFWPNAAKDSVAPRSRRVLVGKMPPEGTLGWLKAEVK
jgi:CRISPR type III-A-associated RAMP protein Csm5